MPVTITQLRKDIFELASQALDGKEISFIHKGKLLKLVPLEPAESKLQRLTPLHVINEDFVEPELSLLQEMQLEWEKDWADL